MQNSSLKIKMKFFSTSFIILFSSFLLTNYDAMAQNSKTQIYAAVLSNLSYTVGAKNPGVGLFVGDENGNEWKNIAFSNMRSFAIEIFPEHGEGLFYTANGNGVIVSRDGGKSWRVTSGWEVTEVLEAAAVPNNPQVLYVGTAYGLWKSTEYGENLQQLTGRFVNSVHLDIEDASRIYVGEENGLVISRNAGKSFKQVKNLPHAVNHIAQDSANPDRLYLGTEDHGLFASINRGKSWQQITGAAQTGTIYSIAVDPKNPGIVFASTFADGILRSLDRGKTWQTITDGIDDIPVYKIVIHPQDSSIIYAGTVNRGILRSTDAGESWKQFALDGTHVWELEIK